VPNRKEQVKSHGKMILPLLTTTTKTTTLPDENDLARSSTKIDAAKLPDLTVVRKLVPKLYQALTNIDNSNNNVNDDDDEALDLDMKLHGKNQIHGKAAVVGLDDFCDDGSGEETSTMATRPDHNNSTLLDLTLNSPPSVERPNAELHHDTIIASKCQDEEIKSNNNSNNFDDHNNKNSLGNDEILEAETLLLDLDIKLHGRQLHGKILPPVEKEVVDESALDPTCEHGDDESLTEPETESEESSSSSSSPSLSLSPHSSSVGHDDQDDGGSDDNGNDDNDSVADDVQQDEQRSMQEQQRARMELQMACKDLGFHLSHTAAAVFYKGVPCLACQEDQRKMANKPEHSSEQMIQTPPRESQPSPSSSLLSLSTNDAAANQRKSTLTMTPTTTTITATISPMGVLKNLCLPQSTPLQLLQSFSSSSWLSAPSSPCLMCGTPSCKAHACSSFRKEGGGIIVCRSCAELFDVDQLLRDCLTARSSSSTRQPADDDSGDEENFDELSNGMEQIKGKFSRMIDIYERVLSLLQRAQPHVASIIQHLHQSTVRQNKTTLGSSATGVVSGALGIAAAATLLTPVGAPLFLSSLVLGGSATTLQTSHKVWEEATQPHQLANRLLALYGMLKSILRFTSTLRYALLSECVLQPLSYDATEATANTSVGDRGRRPRHATGTLQDVWIPRNSLLASRCVAFAAPVDSVGMDLANVAALDSTLGARNALMVSKSALPVLQVAGGVLAGATVLLEATVLTSTILAIRAGNPCHKAQLLQAIVTDLEHNMPDTETLQVECNSYLESLTQRRRQSRNLLTANQVHELVEQYHHELMQLIKREEASAADKVESKETHPTVEDEVVEERSVEEDPTSLSSMPSSPSLNKKSLDAIAMSSDSSSFRSWFKGLGSSSHSLHARNGREANSSVDEASSSGEEEGITHDDYDVEEEGTFANAGHPTLLKSSRVRTAPQSTMSPLTSKAMSPLKSPANWFSTPQKEGKDMFSHTGTPNSTAVSPSSFISLLPMAPFAPSLAVEEEDTKPLCLTTTSPTRLAPDECMADLEEEQEFTELPINEEESPSAFLRFFGIKGAAKTAPCADSSPERSIFVLHRKGVSTPSSCFEE